MKLRSSWPAMASTMRSIRGRGKLSFGHAQLTSVKSMQSCHLSFTFLMSTTLANHSGYSDCPCLEKLGDLLVDCFFPLRSKAPSLLLDWFERWTDIYSMCNDGRINFSHIRLLPCKDILVLSQKLGKETSEVVRELGTDVGEVFRVIINDTGFSSSEGSGRVFTSSRMSSSSKYMVSTAFCFNDAE